MNELARDLLIEQLARLRLACSALGLEPKHIRLEDMTPEIADAMRRQAKQDYLDLISEVTSRKTA